MKKLPLFLTVFMALGLTAAAQNQKDLLGRPSSFVAVSGGLSLPVGNFASTDMTNDQAGAARPGYALQAQYGYHFTPYVGLTAFGFYNRNNVDNDAIFGTSAGVAHFDHFQFYGVTAGLLLTLPVSAKSMVGMALTTGVANVNSPRLVMGGQELLAEQWAAAMPLKADLQYHMKISRRVQFLGGVNYLYVDPKFSVTGTSGEKMDTHQPMSLFGIQVGVALPL